MPASRLDRRQVVVREHDVVGMYVADVPGFIGHIGIAAENHPGLSAAEGLRVTDMQPPLVRGGGPDQVHVHGTVPLTDPEREAIAFFLEQVEREYLASSCGDFAQYVVLPHHAPVIRPQDGSVVYRRFSCGGFVLEAYRFAGIDLIDTNEASLPPVGLDVLRQSYADEQQLRVLGTPRLRERFLGLAGDGPWPIVLPGYLLNSLVRTEAEIRAGPYRPRPGDEFFPAASASGSPS
jgi:hypothetical protein